jgi:hypothetical protein
VNFAGFNAEAGLGGLLTGNAAHGGLSASAGTPFGNEMFWHCVEEVVEIGVKLRLKSIEI